MIYIFRLNAATNMLANIAVAGTVTEKSTQTEPRHV